jgi:chitin binding protein
MRKCSPHVIASLGLASLFAPSASAHIKMLDPPARYDVQGETGIKSCPCGLGGSNRICNVAQDGSDPDRSSRVTRYEAGSTVNLRFEETINHAGRFRVAFDPDGADVADFNAHILADMPDPANANLMVWEIPITIPNETCTNCTLQLVQAMEVSQTTPIADPSGISSYYNCVDIEIVPPGTLGNDPGEQPGDEGAGEAPPADNGGDPSGDDGAEDGAGDEGASDPATGTTPPTNNGGSSSASSGNGMPAPSGTLIPVGMMPGMDTSTGSSSTAASGTGTGVVAMNDTGSAVTGGLNGVAPPTLPNSSASDSSGGCSLAPTSEREGGLGVAALGVLAFIGLRRRTKRAS